MTGAKKVVTREIRPGNARRFVHLNEDEECTGVIGYDEIRLVCERESLSCMARISKIMLMEIEDETGNLVHYEQNGKTYQAVDIDYHLGEVSDIVGEIPEV